MSTGPMWRPCVMPTTVKVWLLVLHGDAVNLRPLYGCPVRQTSRCSTSSASVALQQQTTRVLCLGVAHGWRKCHCAVNRALVNRQCLLSCSSHTGSRMNVRPPRRTYQKRGCLFLLDSPVESHLALGNLNGCRVLVHLCTWPSRGIDLPGRRLSGRRQWQPSVAFTLR